MDDFRKNAAEAVSQALIRAGHTAPDGLDAMFEIPSDSSNGDLALPCFRLSKTQVLASHTSAGKPERKKPQAIGLRLSYGCFLVHAALTDLVFKISMIYSE